MFSNFFTDFPPFQDAENSMYFFNYNGFGYRFATKETFEFIE